MVRTTELLRTEAELKRSEAEADDAARPVASPADVDAPDESEERSVLILTPDPEIAEMLSAALRGEGHDVKVVADAGEAAGMIRDRRAKGIVADVLPDWGEPVVLRRVLARSTTVGPIPFIALTSRPGFDEAFGSEPGPHEWAVAKPISPALLRAAVRSAFACSPRPRRPEPAPQAEVLEHEDESGTDVDTAPASEPLPAGVAPEESSAASTEDTQGDDRAYEHAVEAVGSIFDSPDSHDVDVMREAQHAAEAIVDSLSQSDRVLFHVLDRGQAFSLANHSANVCALCAKIGEGLQYSDSDRRKLAFVGLVHDLGMSRMPRELLLKEGTLDQAEADLIKTHPEHTREVIRSFGQEFEWAAEIAYQEHERENGTGYPLGIAEAAIHEFAKTVAVADIFEAFSHPRSFRKTFVSNEALQKVIEMRGKFCSARIIKALMDQITMFPLGTYVELNTGEIGTVVGISRKNVLSPAVRIEYASSGVRLSEPRVVNLEETPTIFVLRPLSVEDLPSEQSS